MQQGGFCVCVKFNTAESVNIVLTANFNFLAKKSPQCSPGFSGICSKGIMLLRLLFLDNCSDCIYSAAVINVLQRLNTYSVVGTHCVNDFAVADI